MSDEELQCPECPPEGLPAWMGTFADLMSLLMCFFVLLLSFSEMDATKFKKLAGSLADAFGIQNQLQVFDIPKGTSIIAENFSPGKPEPTPIQEIYQRTEDITKLSLDVECSNEFSAEESDSKPQTQSEAMEQLQAQVAAQIEAMKQETQEDARELANALREEIQQGQVEIETRNQKIIIRIREKGSFKSGSSELADKYIPILHGVRDILVSKEGAISIQGHTDNIPIKTSRFRSNWELSSGRAVSVAEQLLADGVLDPDRFVVSGYGDTKPIADNESAEGRAKNRRVEIVLDQDMDPGLKRGLDVIKKNDPERYKALDLPDPPDFNLNPNEIF